MSGVVLVMWSIVCVYSLFVCGPPPKLFRRTSFSSLTHTHIYVNITPATLSLTTVYLYAQPR